MTITKTEENGIITLKVEGWLDVQTTPELHAYAEELPAAEELIFDFADLEYISSAGVREVVAAYRKQLETGGAFRVINVSTDVMDVFSMTGLNKKISITEAGAGEAEDAEADKES